MAAMSLNPVSREQAPELQHHCTNKIFFPYEFLLSHAGCKLSLVYMLFHSDIIFSGSL